MVVPGLNLPRPTSVQKQFAPFAFSGEARVWSKDHALLFAITQWIDPNRALNAPRPACGVAPAAAHARDYSRRGCDHNTTSLTLRWTDHDLAGPA